MIRVFYDWIYAEETLAALNCHEGYPTRDEMEEAIMQQPGNEKFRRFKVTIEEITPGGDLLLYP